MKSFYLYMIEEKTIPTKMILNAFVPKCCGYKYIDLFKVVPTNTLMLLSIN